MMAWSKKEQTFLRNKMNASDQVTVGFRLHLLVEKVV